MKNVTPLLMFATVLLAGCVNHIGDDEEVVDGAPVKLLVETRAEGSTTLTYPITVYAFDTGGNCAASQTIANANAPLALNLLPGDYHLTALAGTDSYTLPSPLLRTSLITLTGSAPATSALMSGNADVKVGDATVSTHIRLSYRVARLDLTLTDVPEEVTAVQVRFSPQYTGYSIQNGFSNAGAVNAVACTKQAAAGTWAAPRFHLFPGSGQQTVFSIALTRADGTTSTYGYTHNQPLLAATPYVLSGSYKQGIAVNGSIEAEGWKAPVNISFNFGAGSGSSGETGGSEAGGDESGSGSASGDAISVTEIPAVPSIWRGACVMGVSNRTTTDATLLVMSLEEWKDLKPADATSSIANYSLASLPGAWRLPTEAEVTPLRNARKALDTTGAFNDLLTGAGGDATSSQALYLCTGTNGSYLKYTWGGATAPESIGTTPSFRVRAVRSVLATITK